MCMYALPLTTSLYLTSQIVYNYFTLFGEGTGNPLQYSCLKIPRTEESGWLQSMGSLRVTRDWVTSLSLFPFMQCWRKWQPTPVFSPGEPQGRGSLVGYRLWGRTVGHGWSHLAAAAAAFYIVRLIMLPFWFAVVIIFYFLFGFWLWKLVNIFYYCEQVTIIHLILLYHERSTENNRILFH